MSPFYKNQFQRNQYQRGITLIEVTLSLTICATLVSGALALYGPASSAQAITQLKSDIATMRTTVRQRRAGLGDFTPGYPLNASLVEAKQIPDTWNSSGPTQTITDIGTGALIYITPTNDLEINGFHILVLNLSQAYCVGLLSGARGWDMVKGGGGVIPFTEITQPISIQTASNVCTGADLYNVIFTAH